MTHPATHVWKPSCRFLNQSILKNDVHPICVRIQQPLRGKGFSLVWNISLYLCFFLLILTSFICKKWYNLEKQNKRIQINTPVSGNAKSWFLKKNCFTQSLSLFSVDLTKFFDTYYRYVLIMLVNFLTTVNWHMTGIFETDRKLLRCRSPSFIYAFVNVGDRAQLYTVRKLKTWFSTIGSERPLKYISCFVDFNWIVI